MRSRRNWDLGIQKSLLTILALSILCSHSFCAKPQVRPNTESSQVPELVLQGGIGFLAGVAFGPNGSWLVTADHISGIEIWDAATGGELRFIPTRDGLVWGVAVSPDGKLVASVAAQAVVLSDVKTGQEVRRFKITPTSGLNAVAFGQQGSWLAAAADNNTVKIWDVANGNELAVLSGYRSGVAALAFSPDGRFMATGDIENRIIIWKLADGTPVVLSGHTDVVRSVSFSPDSTLLASGSTDHSVRLWSVATGKETAKLGEHASQVGAVTFSPNGQLVASGGCDETIKFWDVRSKHLVRSISNPGNQCVGMSVATHPGIPLTSVGMTGLAFRKGGQQIASATNFSLRMWDVATGVEVKELVHKSTAIGIMSSFRLLEPTFSRDGRGLRLEERNGNTDPVSKRWKVEHSVLYWDLISDRNPTMVGEPDSWVGTVSDTSSDGNLVVIAPSIEGLQQDSEGHFGAPYRELGYASRVHDTRTGAEVSLEGELGGGLFSPSGKWIIGGEGPNESVVLWDSATGKQLRVFGSHPEVPYKFERPNPNTTTAEGAISAISPDERLLAASWGKQVRIFDMEDGHDIAKFALPKGDSVSTLTFSPSGKVLLGTVVNHEPAPGKGLARIWNTSKWDEVVTFDVPLDFPSSSEIHALPVFNPDETLVAFTKDQGTAVDLFDTKTGLKVRSFPHLMFGAAFDSSRKLQAAGRGLMELWDVSADKVLARFGLLQGGTDWVVLTPDGLFDGTTNGFASILWRFGNDTFNSASPEAFFNEYFRPGLLSEIYSGARPRARTDISQVDRRQPEITLTLGTTAPATNVSSRKVRVVVQVSEVSADGTHEKGSGAKDVRLFRNGALVHIWRGDVLNGHSTVRLDTDVTVTAGDNRLTAYCFNGNDIKSKDAHIEIKGAESLRRKGNAYLIVIGIDHYSNSSYDLKFAAADAKTFGDEIKSALDRLGTFQHVEIIPLLDAAATKENILRVFGQLSSTRVDSGSPHTGKVAAAEPEDAVFIYFAGHGTAQQSRFYLIPFDLGYKGDREKLNETDLNMILTHSISDSDLEGAFEKIDAGKLLLIIDACNSGQALDAAEKRRGPMNSAGLAQLAYEKGMYILTAAQSYQQASEIPKLKHGLLTYALVNEGLQSGAAAGMDGQIDLRSWLDYAVRRVPELQENSPNEKRKVVYVGADNPLLQQPRVFYRRETGEQPFVVAKIPNGDSSKNRSDGRPSAEKSRGSSLKAGSEESRPYNADQYAARASLAFRWADYQEGVSALDKALRERPNEATWYISRCEGKSQIDDFQGALRDCDRALAFNNLSRAWRAVALYDKGFAERGLSDYKNAQLDYDSAIRAYPELGDAYSIYGERGRLRFATADTSGALSELDEAIRRQPREPLFHLYRGIIRAAMANKAGAFADFQEANRLNPAEPYYAFWLVAFGGAKDSLTLKYCSENKDWASNICRFYLGRISEENLLEQARNATRDASGKLCEALTYVGLLAENDHKLTKQAKSRYVEAIQTGKANLVEFEWAQARLRDKTH